MVKVVVAVAIAIVAMFGSVVPAPAIAIFSDAGGDGFGTLTCTSVGCPGVFNITPFTATWQDPTLTSQPSAKWVGIGADDGGFASGVADGTTSTFEYAFTAATKSVLTLSVWADDTSGVELDGISLALPSPGPYPKCSLTPIGCTPGTEGVFALVVDAGNHVLAFDFSQLGGTNTPYGLLFAGELTATPEPATILLLGSALAAAGVATRRRFRKVETKD